MDTALYDQITNLLEKSQKILLLTHARADCDGLGAALAAYSVLKEMGKEVTVATNDPAQENLQFLPAIDILQNSIAGATDFVITLDTEKTPVGKIKYNVEDHKVNIIVTPKSGTFTESDVSFQKGKAKFDLIFVFDTGNLEHLGPIYDRNVEMFFETPVINMDHHSSNTDFGQVNLVSAVAASTTEILYEYLEYLEKKLNKKFVTEDIATLLLAGIITDTGSFQHANTSPRSMETASKLLDLGARQQEIIKNIYKTKKLSTLKLWGIILSKVQVDPVHRIVWSTISKEDLKEANADPTETEVRLACGRLRALLMLARSAQKMAVAGMLGQPVLRCEMAGRLTKL
jgi:phosphoesterase RecJ-like protein